MTTLFVKICGITRPQDAELAAGLGASALGFMFWPGSPRFVEPSVARAIAAEVPPTVATVGVFVDQDAEAIARIVDEVGLDAAQLHGHESPAFCRDLRVRLTRNRSGSLFREDPGGKGSRSDFSSRTLIKAIGLADNGHVDVAGFDPEVLLLVDALDPVQRGGTGRTVNWDAARDIAATRKTILAGGLNAANIKLAIRSVRPYGIDVSSGVESSPGVKDPNRLRSFFEALHD